MKNELKDIKTIDPYVFELKVNIFNIGTGLKDTFWASIGPISFHILCIPSCLAMISDPLDLKISYEYPIDAL